MKWFFFTDLEQLTVQDSLRNPVRTTPLIWINSIKTLKIFRTPRNNFQKCNSGLSFPAKVVLGQILLILMMIYDLLQKNLSWLICVGYICFLFKNRK